jgi:hypothetical protein
MDQNAFRRVPQVYELGTAERVLNTRTRSSLFARLSKVNEVLEIPSSPIPDWLPRSLFLFILLSIVRATFPISL